MARIRTIKPDFWTDEALTECSLSARLLFIGTWNFADDYGNLEKSFVQLKAKIFPVDNIEIKPLVDELIAHGLLIEYSVNGKIYLHIKGFLKHQIINRPSKPQCPLYEESLSTHGVLTEDSLTTHSETEGKERNGTEVSGVCGDAVAWLVANGEKEQEALTVVTKIADEFAVKWVDEALTACKTTPNKVGKPLAYFKKVATDKYREYRQTLGVQL